MRVFVYFGVCVTWVYCVYVCVRVSVYVYVCVKINVYTYCMLEIRYKPLYTNDNTLCSFEGSFAKSYAKHICQCFCID